MLLSFVPRSLVLFVLILLAMAFFTLLERKVLGYIQLRKGPNKVGLIGLPQPFADALKLLVKEQVKPLVTNVAPFLVAPVLRLILALILWLVYPSTSPSGLIHYSVLMFLAVSRMNVYSTLVAGWSSNSKYSLLGALRRIAQTISYEVSMGLILLRMLVLLKGFRFNYYVFDIYFFLIFLLLPIGFMWFITILAETNRTPFDLAEGESELVSGFNTEYRAGPFALIFIAEYTRIIAIRIVSVFFFFAQADSLCGDFFFAGKILFLAYIFIWLRGTLPRMRYDCLMSLTWKTFLPLILAVLVGIRVGASQF